MKTERTPSSANRFFEFRKREWRHNGVIDCIIVPLRGILLIWTAASIVANGGPSAHRQVDVGLVEKLEGHVVSAGQTEWAELHKLIVASFPDSKKFASLDGEYHVWRVRSEDLVFQANSPVSTDGTSSAGFYWFDLHMAPLSSTAFSTGQRLYFQSCSLVNVWGVSSYVVEAIMGQPRGRPVQIDFGLNAYAPVLIRYAGQDGRLIQNPYDSPAFTCGPILLGYDRAALLDALGSANPMLQLQALTWLAGTHTALTADIADVRHESIADSIHYWTLSSDSTVAQAAATLEGSAVEWVSQAAKYYVSVSKPQPTPAQVLTPILKELILHNNRTGRGGDFDEPEREVVRGDRVVVQCEIKLPNGDVVFNDLNTPDDPLVFEVGGGQVIDGLSKGVLGMRAGGLRTIEVPSAMAYGDAGADVIPPGADLTYRVHLLHIATEERFGMGSERVLRIRDTAQGWGAPVTAGATVNVTFQAYRLDGHKIDLPEYSGPHQIALFTGSLMKRAIIGMRTGGVRRLLLNSADVFGPEKNWFHYGAKVLEIRLDKIVTRG